MGKVNKLLRKGMKKGIADLTSGRDAGIKSYAEGLKAAEPIYRDAANNYDPFIQSGTKLNQMYEDQLTPGATDHYTNTSGYNAVRDAGEQGVLRNNAAIGGLASGNSMADLSKYNVGLQEQYRQQYLDNLFRGGVQGQTAAAGQAGVLQNLGGITNQALGTLPGAAHLDTAARKADVHTGGFSAMATNKSAEIAQQQQMKMQEDANQQALWGNILGAGTQLAGLGMSGGLSGGTLGGNLFGSLFGRKA